MKIKSNIRAGAGNQKRSSSTDSSSINNTVVQYAPQISRCAGI
jgi:hypothetical protein